MQSCFMFGHRDAPLEIQEKMECVVEQLYLEYGISTFYVGGYGAFDRIAGAAVKAAKTRFPEIRLYLLIPYHPAVRPVVLSEGYDGSYYPPLESVPQRFAIVKANQYMVKSCDAVICYARYPGNSKSLLEYDVYRQAVGKNNASTVAHVNVKDVKQFKIPLPSLDKQNQFATFVEQTDKSKLAIQQSLEKLELLKKSLMQEYFG